VHDIALSISQDLDFNVSRSKNSLLKKDPGVSEGTLGFSGSLGDRLRKISFFCDATHASSATASNSFDEKWKSDFL
jgi:hypothetical protein